MSDGENDVDTRRSSRRRESKKVSSAKNALEAMKEARKTGKGYRPNLEVNDVYEEVDEDEYNKIVEQRQRDDFVVDDDGNGYVDTGADFEEEYEDYEASESSKKSKKKKEKKESKKGALDSYFSATTAKKARKDETTAKLNLDDDEDLKDMLGDVLGGDVEDFGKTFLDSDYRASETDMLPTPKNPFKRERTVSPEQNKMTPRPVTKKIKLGLSTTATTKVPKTSSDHSRSEQIAAVSSQEEEDDAYDYGVGDDDFDEPMKMEVDEPAPKKGLVVEKEKPKVENIEVKSEPTEKNVKIQSKPAPSEESATKSKQFVLNGEQWDADIDSKEEKVDVKTGSEQFYVLSGEDGKTKAVRMYWLDAFEDAHRNTGTVFLFGRVRVQGNQFASCCIVVKNIMRQVFFLPRQTKLSNADEDVQDMDVFNEIKKVLQQNIKSNNFKCRKTEKCLMNDIELGNCAGEATSVMEVLYESTLDKLPSDLSGETFSRIFNTTTTPLERLLVERKFMGPGWIDIFNFTEVTAKQTYCDFEFVVDMEKMRNLTYLDAGAEPTTPPIRMLALNVLTTLNQKKENEICMISMLYNPRCNLQHPSADTKYLQRKCLVTRPVGGALPFDLKAQLEARRLDKMATTTANEKALLTVFLARIAEMEPDVIVGHDLSAMISLLVSRLDKLKIANWSRISRLKRLINIGKVGHSKSGQWELTAGRLLLDSRLAAMELVKARSFDLSELASQLLNIKRQNVYVNEVANMYKNSQELINLINWSWTDPLLSLRIAVQLNALPLFTQITNIVGGVASRTLMGGRAERNEYLLLHAFAKSNLIAPNKYNAFSKKGFSKEAQNATMAYEGEDNEANATVNGGKSKQKAQYSGGLVLEPKKGLYDTLILLLDFNSLYPSIIQEYNICFTTVPHTKDSDELPEVPTGGQEEGVLPREIRKLVECRREVKAIMKGTRNEAEKRQLDIRQMALKLTANSMYGCLGFQYSRFYAKPLAALVTAKGREILMHSRDLVEKLGYSVVYGDTDSIMIDTNSVDINVAKKLGFEIKKQVNKCHRLLELELDGVFKRLLLLKKKKYAALTVNVDSLIEARELKGLDIVRRDWSQLAKETGTAVVNLILDSSLTRDELASAIDALLRNMRSRLDGGEVPREMFQIAKQLTRNPSDYSDVKAQPHAAVAKRLNGSGRFTLRHGDIVEYIVCEDGTTNPATQRAYHRTEMDGDENLKIDLHYYLAQQVHPVVSRLVAPIEETDAVRIAEALGMDPTNYRRAAAAAAAQTEEEENEYVWQPPNYDLCDGLVVKCPNKSCGKTTIIRSFFSSENGEDGVRAALSQCPHCSGKWYRTDSCDVIANELDRVLAGYVERHMSAAFKCDEPTCETRSVAHTMRWCREGLECPKCSSGILRKEYTSKQLFEQQMFLRGIVDVDEAEKSLKPDVARELQSRGEYAATRLFCQDLMEVIQSYLDRNAYNRVDLAFLFAPMRKLQLL